jgi:hypothetical protein
MKTGGFPFEGAARFWSDVQIVDLDRFDVLLPVTIGF